MDFGHDCGNCGRQDPDLVEGIRRLMFVFEDISKFSNKDLQTVLKNVESSQWAMALKTASEDLKQKIDSHTEQIKQLEQEIKKYTDALGKASAQAKAAEASSVHSSAFCAASSRAVRRVRKSPQSPSGMRFRGSL